jgi:hypothetical protein
MEFLNDKKCEHSLVISPVSIQRTKPEFESPPQWGQQAPLGDIGLSQTAQRLAALLNQRSRVGMSVDPLLEASEVLHCLEVEEDQLALAADELQDLGWVTLHTPLGSTVGFGRISPTSQLFWDTDQILRSCDPEADAKHLAGAFIRANKQAVTLAEMHAKLNWSPRRINPAADYLRLNDIVGASHTLNSHPYAFNSMWIKPRTKRFASERS